MRLRRRKDRGDKGTLKNIIISSIVTTSNDNGQDNHNIETRMTGRRRSKDLPLLPFLLLPLFLYSMRRRKGGRIHFDVIN